MFPRARRVLLSVGLVLLSAPLAAVDRAAFEIGAWSGMGMAATGITLELALPGTSPGPLRMRIATADFGPQLGRATQLTVDCATPLLGAQRYACEHALLRGTFERFGSQSIDARVAWLSSSRTLEFSVSGVRFAAGKVVLRGAWRPDRWSIDVVATNFSVAALRQALGNAWPDGVPVPPTWTLDGRIERAHLAGTFNSAMQRFRLDVAVDPIDFADPQGTTAGQHLAADVMLEAVRAGPTWQFNGSVHERAGELLIGRTYWNFGPQPLAADFAGRVNDDSPVLLDRLHLTVGGLLTADATAAWEPSSHSSLTAASVEFADLDLAGLPPQTRAGLFLGSPVPQLAGRGHAHGRIDIRDGALAALDLTLDDVTLADAGNGLGIEGLAGRVRWQAAAAAEPATLGWRKGALYGVGIGPAAIRFTAGGSYFALLQPVRVPILDGGLQITTLQVARAGRPDMSLQFAADLEPLDMRGLCTAFGWPVFGGTLSGAIPQLSLDQGVLTLGGALHARVFDGLVTVSGLTISDVLGARPRLAAGVAIEGLDLAAVTGAFSFGAITGRLDGRVDGLQLVGWEPTAFDANFHTPPNDASKHRISQRAVENISSIGGGAGASAALQRGVLRFFKEFSYQKLGLSCKLENDVCSMDGVEPHPRGYYLVKGSGIPRIDVIGDSHRVDWPSMVASLKELSTSHATIVSP